MADEGYAGLCQVVTGRFGVDREIKEKDIVCVGFTHIITYITTEVYVT